MGTTEAIRRFFLAMALSLSVGGVTACGGSGGSNVDTDLGDDDVAPSNIESVDLGFATLSIGSFNLAGGRTNAREVYQMTHYIGRTHGENEADKVHVPIRSYVATCAVDSNEPRMFVSVSVLDGDAPDASTYGSVYELKYDAASGGFQPTGNRALLEQCYESHGITVSSDCSRVAVLCNAPYKASERYPIIKDIVAEHGTTWMNTEDNHDSANSRDNYKENDQIWLLEWDGNAPLSETPAAYVVNKMHGGTHLGAQELIYVENDSQGRASYGFSVTARVFDGGGGSHYSAGLTVVNRSDWSVDMNRGRGWDWACGDGHVANIRAFYNEVNEMYGAICTSDWNDWFGGLHGQLGTIAIKMEDSSSISEGRAVHFVPSHSSMVTNGGGHKVLPVDGTTNLALIVAPKLIEDDDMDRFLTETLGLDTSLPGPFEQDCADWDSNNCFFTYLIESEYVEEGVYPSIPQQGLFSADVLEARSLSRIGIARVDAEGDIDGHAFNWFIRDDDCQVSDPQMVDLQNGRYLAGYGTFQCVSEGEGYNRIGNKRSIIPRSFHLMEVDMDGTVLAGPIDIGEHGWGGLDDIQVVGPGRAAWVYKPDATLGTEQGPLESRWNTYLYDSNAN
ncbi:MAG: hypothetical protein AAGF92_18565 [Myxococcota bacterium]